MERVTFSSKVDEFLSHGEKSIRQEAKVARSVPAERITFFFANIRLFVYKIYRAQKGN